MARDALGRLREEHAAIRARLRSALRAGGEGSLGDLPEMLEAHLDREERWLYSRSEAIFGTGRAAGALLLADHRRLRRAAAALLRKGPRSLRGFARDVERHFEREERVVFPFAAARIPAADLLRVRSGLRRG